MSVAVRGKGKQVAQSGDKQDSGKKKTRARTTVSAGKKAIEDAIVLAGLSRCLDVDQVAVDPTRAEEEEGIRDVCGILPPISHQSDHAEAAVDLHVDGSDDDARFSFSALEDIDLGDIGEDEVQNEAEPAA